MSDQLKAENPELYTKLKKYPSRLSFLIFLCVIIGLTITSLVFTNMLLGLPWIAMCVPILLVGGILTIYPHTEEWEYIPWQSVSEKREQTFYD